VKLATSTCTPDPDPSFHLLPSIIEEPNMASGGASVQRNVKAYPISPVAGVVAIRLAIEVVHISSHPVACAQQALAKVQQGRVRRDEEMSRGCC